MKTLVLDRGNSTLFAGVFRDTKLMRSARIDVGRGLLIPSSDAPKKMGSGDPALQLQKLARGKLDCIALSSVVPKQTPRLVSLLKKHFGLVPVILTATAVHGLRVAYEQPEQLGVDRLANVLGAQKLYPNKNVIVVDCGTATTLTLLSREGTLLGGTIMPGLEMSAAVLNQRTARLPKVSLITPAKVVGRDTETAIRSGILHGHAGAIRELIARSKAEAFGRSPVVVIGTGGQVTHFKAQSLFTAVETGLILHGLQAFASDFSAHA